MKVFPLDAPAAALAVGGHYREMSGKRRELARLATPHLRKELADLVKPVRAARRSSPEAFSETLNLEEVRCYLQ